MPADNRLRLYDHQGIHNAWRNPIKAGKNETIESGEGNSLRRFPSQHIELVAQRHNLRLKRGSRSEQPDDHPRDQFEHIPHETEHRPIRAYAPVG
jgi:hypothetical protein